MFWGIGNLVAGQLEAATLAEVDNNFSELGWVGISSKHILICLSHKNRHRLRKKQAQIHMKNKKQDKNTQADTGGYRDIPTNTQTHTQQTLSVV